MKIIVTAKLVEMTTIASSMFLTAKHRQIGPVVIGLLFIFLMSLHRTATSRNTSFVRIYAGYTFSYLAVLGHILAAYTLGHVNGKKKKKKKKKKIIIIKM